MKFVTTLSLLLLLMVGTRLANTYVSPTGLLSMPENYFGIQEVGRDLIDFGVVPWYAVLRGTSPVVYGYGTVLASGMSVQVLALAGLCEETYKAPCGTYIYIGMIAASVIGLTLLLFAFIRRQEDRAIGILTLCVFLLGIPAAKAFVAGNPDIFLSVILGTVLLLMRSRFKASHPPISSSIVLGIILGFFLNAKGFLLPFVLSAIILSRRDIPLLLSFAVSFAATSLWPWLYQVQSHIFSVFLFASDLSQTDAATMITRIHYGNIAVVPYVSNILHTLENGSAPITTHTALTVIGTLLVTIGIGVKPFFDEQVPALTRKRLKSSYPLFLLLISLSYIITLTATTWSYDYRIFYGLPILIAYLAEPRDRRTTNLLYLAIFFLLTKSLFIPKDRIMTVFLYLHFYFLLRTALSHWKSRLRVV